MSTRITINLQEPLPFSVFEDPLVSAILLSLFCDARALPEDKQTDPRGWWGDNLSADQTDRWGGRLWLLASRAKNIPETLRKAEDYAEEALGWMLDDKVATTLTVTASALSNETLLLAIQINGRLITLEITS